MSEPITFSGLTQWCSALALVLALRPNSAALALEVWGFGLGLDTVGLVNITGLTPQYTPSRKPESYTMRCGILRCITSILSFPAAFRPIIMSFLIWTKSLPQYRPLIGLYGPYLPLLCCGALLLQTENAEHSAYTSSAVSTRAPTPRTLDIIAALYKQKT